LFFLVTRCDLSYLAMKKLRFSAFQWCSGLGVTDRDFLMN
jgi:hypothetical protein